MKYYVTSDVHGYFSELKEELKKKGYFDDKEPHKLIICGDIFDRGNEAAELQAFILDLLEKDGIILIKGNHEDLAMEFINDWNKGSYLQSHHHRNGTIDTFIQLTEEHFSKQDYSEEEVRKDFLGSAYVQLIIPSMIDYYETNNYIFTHGWIPCTCISLDKYTNEYISLDNWRESNQDKWNKARWINGMEAAKAGAIEKGKTIVCGHWHCSFGHSNYENDGGEFDNNPNFSPYYGEGVIALDACTPISKKVNCIVIEN